MHTHTHCRSHSGSRHAIPEAEDSWERFLAAIQPADATLLYKIAREKDRRESEAVTCPCAAPSLHADVWYTGTKEKCGVLADYFHEKFRRRREQQEGRSNRIDSDGGRVPALEPTGRAAGLRPTSGGFPPGRRHLSPPGERK